MKRRWFRRGQSLRERRLAEAEDLVLRMVDAGYLKPYLDADDRLVFEFGPEPPITKSEMFAFWHFLKNHPPPR